MDLGIAGLSGVVMASSRGLGLACAAALSKAGVNLVMNGRDEKALEHAATSVGAAGFLSGDMSDVDSIQALSRKAIDTLGAVHILVINCGGPPTGPLASMDDAKWNSGYEATLMSAVRAIRVFAPLMESAKWGRIVIIGASGYREPARHLVVSDAMRAGVAVLAKVVSDELAPKGITVNTIAPGMFETDRLHRLLKAGDVQQASHEIPVGRLGRPEELGALCAFLCSRLAAFITGQTIVVDGGTQHGI